VRDLSWLRSSFLLHTLFLTLSDRNDGKVNKKAALLSGTAGLGKTSAATILAREFGYAAIEFNASDARSKNAMKDHVQDIAVNKTVGEYFTQEGVSDSGRLAFFFLTFLTGGVGFFFDMFDRVICVRRRHC
jgi:DNA polymerase III delta prime subunit